MNNAASPCATLESSNAPLIDLALPNLRVPATENSCTSEADISVAQWPDAAAICERFFPAPTEPTVSRSPDQVQNLRESARATTSDSFTSRERAASRRSSRKSRKSSPDNAAPPRATTLSISDSTSSKPSTSLRRTAPPANTTPTSRPYKRPRLDNLKAPPAIPKDEAEDEDLKPAAKPAQDSDCCICMTAPEFHARSTVDGCEHQFCFDCIAKWSDRENTCPLCKARFTKINRCNPMPQSSKKDKKIANTKTVKNKDQRSDLAFSGSAMEGLLASIASRGGGFRAFHAGHGFASRIVFESRLEGFGSIFELGDGRRRMVFGSMESDDDEEEEFWLSGFDGLFAPAMASRDGDHSPGQTARMPTRRSIGSRTAALQTMLRIRRQGTRPAASAQRAASSENGAAPASAPSMISVVRAPAAAAPGADQVGTSANTPLEIEDDSDDEVEVVEDIRSIN